MTDRLYVVIPAYNERETITQVVDQWHSVVERTGAESRLVVIDDGSKDDTAAILARLSQTYPQLDAQSKPNSGHGGTVLYGYRYALDHDADFVFQTDSDGQTDPDEFWKFWECRNEYDLIIGKRAGRQDGLSRIIVTRVLKLVVRMCFGVDAPDANTPFRLMTRNSLAACMEPIPEGFFLSNVVLTAVYYKRDLRILSIPITFKPRQGGVNSINLKRIIKIGYTALKDFRELNRRL
jgi:glycosyltransferase involved in cell wall biosynthesis